MVRECNKAATVAFVEVQMEASKGYIPVRLIDEFGVLWESKSPTPQAACTLESNRFSNDRESQGAWNTIMEQHLLLPANSDSSLPD